MEREAPVAELWTFRKCFEYVQIKREALRDLVEAGGSTLPGLVHQTLSSRLAPIVEESASSER